MAEQMGRSDSCSSAGRGDSGGAGGGSAVGDQGSFAEVTVIDSQFQHFSSYIEVIRVFKCRLCTFCSPLEHVIASHMSEVHFPRRCFLCKQCLFVFEDRAQLVSHLDSAHGTKSIAVCFGDTPSSAGYSSPPTLRMMMRTAEGEERIQQQMMEETAREETRNGRVTSSTGNLANLTNAAHKSPPQPDCVEHPSAESRMAQPEGGRASEPPSVTGDTRQEQMQSRSSSCHPSSSNQVYSSPEIIDCEAPTPRQEGQEAATTQQPPPSSLPPSSELHVTIGNTYCQSYIKTEPISPVRGSVLPQQGQKPRPYLGRSRHDPRSYMRRWSLTENSMRDGGEPSTPARMSRSFDTPGSGSTLQSSIEEDERMSSEGDSGAGRVQKSTPGDGEGVDEPVNREENSGSNKRNKQVDETNSNDGKGRPMEKSKSLDTGKAVESRSLLGVSRSFQGGRSVDGRPPRLVRQSVVEESPRSSPQPRVQSEDNLSSQEQNEVSMVVIPCSAAEGMRRENFSRSFPSTLGRLPGEPYSNQKPSEGSSNFRPTLRDLVSSRMERGDRQLPPATVGDAPGPGQDPSIPPSSSASTWMRAGRVRSYSISEGEMRGLQRGSHPDGTPLKPAEAQIDATASERDHPSNMHPRLPPGNPQMPPMLHQYPGLVYQPYSIEGEPKHLRYYNQGPRMAGPGPLDGPPHPLRVRPEENGQLPGQNQPMEESVLYRYLRSSNSRKYRRNSISVSTLACGEVPPAGLMPSHGPPPRGMVPHAEGADMMAFDRQRGLPWPPRHHPDHPFPQQGPYPSHVPPYPMAWKEKFDGSQMSPNTPASADQRPGAEYGGSRDIEHSGRGETVNGPNGVVVVNGKVIRAKQGEGGESNQDLAKDITRQVQQAMGVTEALYNSADRHLLPWVDGNDRVDSPDDPMDGDALGPRRSRKSTFNIYREIPERKRKLDQEEEEKIKHSYNADGSFDYYSLTGWKAYKCDLCKKRRFKTASELQEHKQRKHGLQRNHSSQGSLNGHPEAAPPLSAVDNNEPDGSPASG